MAPRLCVDSFARGTYRPGSAMLAPVCTHARSDSRPLRGPLGRIARPARHPLTGPMVCAALCLPATRGLKAGGGRRREPSRAAPHRRRGRRGRPVTSPARRSPGWPQGMYSLLAGFVEPGETLEAAVRREVFEESGVIVGEVNYLASQPWPFPASLMFGCAGVATSREITIDPKEIEDALWITKEEMMDIFAGQHAQILPARKGAIAHFLLENWLADKLD